MDNTSDICRLCMLNGGKSMESVFCQTNTGCIADTIASVTQLTLYEGDGLPVAVCQKCLFHLDVAHTFIQRCTSSDKFLRSLLLGGVEVHPVSDTPPVATAASNTTRTGGVEIVPIRNFGGPFTNNNFTIKKEVLDDVNSEEVDNSHMTFIIGDGYEDDNITITMEGLNNPIPESMDDDQESGSCLSDSSSDPPEDDDDDEDYKPVLRYQRIKLESESPTYDITTRSIQLTGEKRDQTENKSQLCSQRFDNKKDLKEHLTNYSGKHPYQCGALDSTKSSQLAVNKITNPSTKGHSLKCSDSKFDKSFPRKLGLSLIDRKHFPEGKHKCSHCDRRFHQLILLRNHSLIHQ